MYLHISIFRKKHDFCIFERSNRMQHAKRHFYITIFYYYYFYIFVRLCLTKKTIF
jgi:hypothetical protein